MIFKLTSPYKPTGDQPQAIEKLVRGLKNGVHDQVLLGVTGSGKTFTMANVITQLQRPTLIISHNKTLAAQLYQEFKTFFPGNGVSYFVSYYDYYQPEAYIPQSDTYIEKETDVNDEIDKLRLAATTNLLTRSDTIVVASVSCIYNLGSPKEYGSFVLEARPGTEISREAILTRLVELQYVRSDYDLRRATFRVRGETIDIYPAYLDTAYRIFTNMRAIEKIIEIDPLTGETAQVLDYLIIYPAKHYMMDISKRRDVFAQIEADLQTQIDKFKHQGKLIEAQCLNEKVHYDLEMLQQLGFVNGIENYSRYFDGRKPGEPPYSLLDYFQEKYGTDWLLLIDESHMTVPQIRGMYNGDRSRKQTLIDFGFRLPAAIDNRPLKFEEFLRRSPQTIYTSATPDEWEKSRALECASKFNYLNSGIVEQLVRPTGLVDPQISVRPVKGQIEDLISEIKKRVTRKERILVTTLTKRMAEDLTEYLHEQQINVQYLHADIQTLERSDILDDLRKGTYDVLVGINLLREGLDLPEVSLVAILDADKEGFLRSSVALIQTMGRAARHISGQVIMYADRVTGSMERAIEEVNRRRKAQIAYNKKHHITPISINKPIRDRLVEKTDEEIDPVFGSKPKTTNDKLNIQSDRLTSIDKKKLIKLLEVEMRLEAQALNFEMAAQIRDKIRELKTRT